MLAAKTCRKRVRILSRGEFAPGSEIRQAHAVQQTRHVAREPVEAARHEFGVDDMRQAAGIGHVQGAAALAKSPQATKQINQRPDQAGIQIDQLWLRERLWRLGWQRNRGHARGPRVLFCPDLGRFGQHVLQDIPPRRFTPAGRYPRAVAKCKINSILLRTRSAVTVRVIQIFLPDGRVRPGCAAPTRATRWDGRPWPRRTCQ